MDLPQARRQTMRCFSSQDQGPPAKVMPLQQSCFLAPAFPTPELFRLNCSSGTGDRLFVQNIIIYGKCFSHSFAWELYSSFQLPIQRDYKLSKTPHFKGLVRHLSQIFPLNLHHNDSEQRGVKARGFVSAWNVGQHDSTSVVDTKSGDANVQDQKINLSAHAQDLRFCLWHLHLLSLLLSPPAVPPDMVWAIASCTSAFKEPKRNCSLHQLLCRHQKAPLVLPSSFLLFFFFFFFSSFSSNFFHLCLNVFQSSQTKLEQLAQVYLLCALLCTSRTSARQLSSNGFHSLPTIKAMAGESSDFWWYLRFSDS